MNDRRVLRRYLALVHHAEDVLDESLNGPATPAPAEAATEIEDLIAQVGPSVSQMVAMAAEPGDIREVLAGWVH